MLQPPKTMKMQMMRKTLQKVTRTLTPPKKNLLMLAKPAKRTRRKRRTRTRRRVMLNLPRLRK
jgi:hypothetical protein